LLACSGCATMIKGTRQAVKVETSPSGAMVKGNFQTIKTPGILKLKRSEFYTLDISMPGYQSTTIRLDKEDNKLMWLDVLIFPLIIPGLIVDSHTDAGFDFTPSNIFLKLDPVDSSINRE